VWPLASVPFGMFGKSTFQLWASVALCWGWAAGLTIIFLPLLENRTILMKVMACKDASAEPAKPVETATA
jgi:hypothetical protein